MSLKSLVRQNYVNKSIGNSTNPVGTGTGVAAPVITSIVICDSSYNSLDDTALDPAGSYVKLIGTGFKTGCTVYFNNESLTATFVSAGEVRIQTPATTVGAYNIMLFNPTNQGGAIYLNLSVSNYPSYTTSSGSLGAYYEANTISNTIVATGDTPLSYSLYSGSLPSGATLNSDGTITGTSPAESGSTTYSFVVNVKDAQGQDATRSFSLTINTDPVTWSTPTSNQVITAYEYTPISNVTLSASTAAGKAITYTSNTLPGGITLSGNTISGTNNTVGNTYTRLTATAATTGRTATQDVVFNVNQDVVTWSSPADATAYTLAGGAAMANVSLSATSAAGRTISYTANALPSGVSLSGDVLYGTPDTAETVYTLLTATANTTNRSATRTISWTINLGDTYWKNTVLLLNAVTPTTTFINDASLNNMQLTIAGDTKPNNFNPYQEGYYSYNLDGAGYILGTLGTGVTIGTNDFCLEGWGYWTSFNYGSYGAPLISLGGATAGELMIRATKTTNNTTSANFFSILGGSTYIPSSMYSSGISVGTLTLNRWHHLAIQRVSGTWYFYIDGVMLNSTSAGNASLTLPFNKFYIGNDLGGTGGYLQGNASNIRLTVGSVPYSTGGFTPPTTPLQRTADTKFLSAQSNRFKDNDPTNAVFTSTGVSKVIPAHPFTTPTTASYNTQYSTYFDGSTGYLTATTGTAFPIGTEAFTVEMFIQKTNAWNNNNQVLLISGTSGSFQLWVDSSVPSIKASFNSGATPLSYSTSSLALNTWYHLAITRSGNNFTMYINGTSVATGTDSGSFATPTSIVIGNYSSGTSNIWNGLISNLRIVRGSAITPPAGGPTSTLTAVSGTSLLTCQNATLIDNSTNNLTITSNGQAKPIAVSPFTMTTSNTTVTSLGSAYFDGTGDYLSFNPGTIGKFRTGDFTVECWFYPTATMTTQYLFEMRDASNSTGWLLAYGTNVSGSITWYNGSGNLITEISPTTKINAWNHVAFCRSGTSNRLFINGVQTNVTVTDSTDYNNNNTTAYIGSRFDQNNSVTSLFTGHISDARIIKGTALYTANFLPSQAPLTPVANTQLLTCQTNGGATNNGFVDQSSFNNVITRNGNPTQGTFSPFSQTGWSNYIGTTAMGWQTPASSHLTATGYSYFQSGMNLTIEAWINPLSRHGGGGASFGYVAGDMNLAGGTLYWSFGPDSDGKLCLGWYTGSIVTCKSTNVIPLNTWTHIAVSISSGTIKLFINGVSETLVGTTSTSNVSGNGSLGYIASGGYLYGGTTWQGFNGYITDLRISKAALYSTTFTPNTTPLAPSASTGLLVAQTNRFIDNSVNNYTLTLTGVPTIQAYSPFGGVTSVPASYSNYFDGTGDYLTTTTGSTFALSGDFTIEMWVYPTAAVGTFKALVATGGSGSSDQLLIGTDSTVNGILLAGVKSDNGVLPAVGAWTHIAVSRTGTSVYFFLNGEQQGTTKTSSATALSSSATLSIGYRAAAGDGAFTGYISNLRVIKGTGLYTSAFTPSTAPLTTTSQGATASQVSLLTCQSATMIDNSASNLSLTAFGDVKPRTFNPFGTTSTTGVSYTPSVNGGSMYFDGTGDYLTSPYSLATELTTGDFTIEFWMYKKTSGDQYIVHNRPTSSSAGWAAMTYSEGIRFYFTGGTSVNTTSTIALNQWCHVALVNTSGTMKIYFNGVQQYSGSIGTGTAATGTNLFIGCDNGPSFSGFFNGYLSDLKITKAALYSANFYPGPTPATTTTTIGANTYTSSICLTGTSGGIIDAHGTNNLETVGNTQLASEDPYAGSYYSIYCDGTSDGLTFVPGTFGANDFTVEFWWYSNVSTDTALFNNMHWYNGYTPASMNIMYYSGAINASLFTGGGSDTGYAPTTTLTRTHSPIGKWTHIAISRTGGNFYLGVDGVVTSASITSNTGLNLESRTTYALGAWQANSGGPAMGLNGNVSNFRIVKGSALYTTNYTVPTTPLTAVSGTTLLTCQSNKFVDNSASPLTITRLDTTKIASKNPFQQNTGKSLYFDGTGDYLISPNYTQLTLPGDFTVEGWMYVNSLSVAQPLLCLGDGNSSPGVVFGINTSGKMFIYSAGVVVTGGTTIAVGQWYHLAFVRSSGLIKIYLNGLLDGPSAGTVASTTYSGNSTYPVFIGREIYAGSVGGQLNGYIKDLRITRGVARYTANTSVPTTTFSVK